MMWCRRVAQVTKRSHKHNPLLMVRSQSRSGFSESSPETGGWTKPGYGKHRVPLSSEGKRALKSNSGTSCVCLTCIGDNYPLIYNQYTVKIETAISQIAYVSYAYSQGKIISELIRSYDS